MLDVTEDAVRAEAVPVGVRLRGPRQRDGGGGAGAGTAAGCAAATATAPEHLPGQLLLVPADLPDLRHHGARTLPARLPRLHEWVSERERVGCFVLRY